VNDTWSFTQAVAAHERGQQRLVVYGDRCAVAFFTRLLGRRPRTKRGNIVCNKPIRAIIDNMISLKSATEIARELAQRVRERRLRRGWTQAELAERAGVTTSTYILFERTGRIAVIRLLKILDVLDLVNEFDDIGRQEDLTGMTLAQITQPERKRGARKRV
jgi:DNA-binding XRE family transcriptional regulator